MVTSRFTRNSILNTFWTQISYLLDMKISETGVHRELDVLFSLSDENRSIIEKTNNSPNTS